MRQSYQSWSGEFHWSKLLVEDGDGIALEGLYNMYGAHVHDFGII